MMMIMMVMVMTTVMMLMQTKVMMKRLRLIKLCFVLRYRKIQVAPGPQSISGAPPQWRRTPLLASAGQVYLV